MGRLLSIFVPYKFLHSLFLSLSSSVMRLMTNINNSEKSGGTVGKEKQNITETPSCMAPPYPSAVCLYFSLFLVACNAQSTYLLTETRHPASADALALFL